LVGQQDPIFGAQESVHGGQSITGEYRIPCAGGREIVLNLPRFVTTIGSVYLFMPGLGGLRYLARHSAAKSFSTFATASFSLRLNDWLTARTETVAIGAAPDPGTFDPRDTAFRADPFKIYRWFRENCPVVKLDTMDSTWVFKHRDVTTVARSLDMFRKRKSDDDGRAGLLNMDPPAHASCRAEIENLFNGVLATVAPSIPALVAETYARCRTLAQTKALDWIEQFAKPVAQGAFFDVLGLTPKECAKLIRSVEKLLQLASPVKDPARQTQFEKESLSAALNLLRELKGHAREGRLYAAIQRMSGPHDPVHNVSYIVISAADVERTVNTITLAMAGFLPLQWFIAIATWRLLENEEALLKQLKSDASISNRDVVDELLRFDMSAPLSDRYVINDNTVLGGVTLKKDDRITLAFTSANHDQDEFGPDADQINFKRATKGPGYAFGYPNQHSCLGREMVYLVMEPVIQTLRDADPVPHLEKDFEPSWGAFADSAMFRSMAVLKVHC
jgi:cytochrome P450